MKTLWGGVGYDAYVQRTSENQERTFVTRWVQIQGRANAKRDFRLGSFGLGPPITDTSRDYHDNDEHPYNWDANTNTE